MPKPRAFQEEHRQTAGFVGDSGSSLAEAYEHTPAVAILHQLAQDMAKSKGKSG